MAKRKKAAKPRTKSAKRASARHVEVIAADIRRSRRLGKGTRWVIAAEVRVAAGVTLTIADGAEILIANGVVPESKVRRASLIFEPGSMLAGGRFTVRAASAAHRPVKAADNGGLWFLGTHAAGAKDGIAVKASRGRKPSRFRARSITVSYLGRRDTYRSPRTGKELDIGDDIDGISVLGVGPDEWRVAEVRSLHSADDGFDVTNSHIRLDRLEVRNPTEDGLNVSSSRVEVRHSLVLDMPKSSSTDRNLFDLETDAGGSYVELPRGCWVRLRGVFGDEVRLTSDDMPRPVLTAGNERRYVFAGKLRSDALIHSLTSD